MSIAKSSQSTRKARDCSVSLRVDNVRKDRPLKEFATDSQYEGTWDTLGMSGYGTYTYPNGVIYEGDFVDGVFNGEGELRFPDGVIIHGTFKDGKTIERKLLFADGLEYSEDDWKYCQKPDRRFTIEYELGLSPAGDSFLTAEVPSREVPPGYYDTGDGFFLPRDKVIYRYSDLTSIVRSPPKKDIKWIMENCRTNPDVPVGPCPHFLDDWADPELELKAPPPPAALTKSLDSDIDDSDIELDLDREKSEIGTAGWRRSRVSMYLRKRMSSIFTDTKKVYTPKHVGMHLEGW